MMSPLACVCYFLCSLLRKSAQPRIRLASTAWVVFCLLLTPKPSVAQTTAITDPTTFVPAFRPDRIIIQPKAGGKLPGLASFHSARQAAVLRTFEGIGRLQVLRVPAGETVSGLIARYRQSGLVEFAEPDYIRTISATPNDPKYLDGTLWGLHNLGQNGGTTDADIDAPEGWDIRTSASNIVVAVLDTGIRATHEDLAANMWVNPTGGGYGFNALTGTNDPRDDHGHGTQMAGILGAVGGNGKGMAGVAWSVQIMALKCMDSSGNGSDSDIIECIEYARTNGARIINASFDGPAYSQALANAINRARDAGILFVASCGNNTLNVDVNPRYPACYDIDNIVTVAYTTRTDQLGSLSNYGATNVDLAAPGAHMYSTFFTADNAYLGGSFLQGSSLAAPQVTGALALMLASHPEETHQQILTRLLQTTDPLPALAGKCVTGGRLNLRKALSPFIRLAAISRGTNAEPLQLRVSGDPQLTALIETTTDLKNWLPIYTNVTSPNGTFEFTPQESASSAHRFYRAHLKQ